MIYLVKGSTLKSGKIVVIVGPRTQDLVVHRWVLYLSAKAAVGSRVLNKLVKHGRLFDCHKIVQHGAGLYLASTVTDQATKGQQQQQQQE